MASSLGAPLLLLLGSLLVIGCSSQCLTKNDSPATMRQDAAEILSNARFDFALESLKKISEIETQDNIFFSPHSLYEALGLAYSGAHGKTETSLRKALNIPEDFSKLDVQRFYAYEKSLELARKVRTRPYHNRSFQSINKYYCPRHAARKISLLCLVVYESLVHKILCSLQSTESAALYSGQKIYKCLFSRGRCGFRARADRVQPFFIPDFAALYADEFFEAHERAKGADVISRNVCSLMCTQANSSDNYEYRVANRLWLSSAKRLRQCVLDFYGEELQREDFRADPEASRKRINDWVSSETRGNIQDLLPPSAIDESTDAVLANAVYFKGLWQSKFLPENTKRDVFYLGQENMTIATFMRQKGSFSHMVSEELGVHILQLPYKGDDVSMYILLPPFVQTQQAAAAARSAGQPKSNGVRQLLHRLSDNQDSAKELRDILDSGMPAREVDLQIPKFSLERELPVKTLLDAMGAESVLDSTNSDFGAFVEEGEKPITLGDAVHRAKIEITEEGTTAAAATALFSFRSSRPTEPAFFTANHPFAYFIYDRPSRTVLFAGIFRRPNKR
ncbi:unnamed protein product [Trichogramma brassicae]|uniref:Serpin domain-containing protein n=1 Tax=Trichogramma brassicae TaxID=86971 RepID=A0A6H5IC20_9HYME|nr:unnamed protein product [Trichogramma brassicae]